MSNPSDWQRWSWFRRVRHLTFSFKIPHPNFIYSHYQKLGIRNDKHIPCRHFEHIFKIERLVKCERNLFFYDLDSSPDTLLRLQRIGIGMTNAVIVMSNPSDWQPWSWFRRVRHLTFSLKIPHPNFFFAHAMWNWGFGMTRQSCLFWYDKHIPYCHFEHIFKIERLVKCGRNLFFSV